jgi:hypothetical protein
MWYYLRALALSGWLFGIVGGLLMELQVARIVLLIMVIIHPLEIPFGVYLARRNNYPIGKAALNTLLYGFVFWLPTFLVRKKGETE